MPKDKTENIARYKIRGGHLNEFDFHKNQQALAQQEHAGENVFPGTSPREPAKQVQDLTRGATASSKKNVGGKQSNKSASKASAAAKANKRSAKKSTGAGTSKKTGTKKASAKKK